MSFFLFLILLFDLGLHTHLLRQSTFDDHFHFVGVEALGGGFLEENGALFVGQHAVG